MRWRIWLAVSLLVCLLGQVSAEDVYQVSEKIELFENLSGWRAAGDHPGPKTAIRQVSAPVMEGKGAAELTYDFIGSASTLNFCEYIKLVALPGKCAQMSFWVHGDGSGHFLRIRLLDRSGEFLQYTVGALNWLGWQQKTIDLNRPDGHWYGDNDGKPTYPLKLNSIVVDSKAKSFVGQGRIYLDAITAEALVPASESLEFYSESAKVGNIFTPDEPVKIKLNFINHAAVARQLEINYWVDSAAERTIASGKLNLEVQARAKASSELELPVRTTGSFKLKLYLFSTDRVIRMEKELPFSRVLPQPAVRGEGIFGVCTHFAQNKGDIDKNIPLAALAGANWIRDEMYWSGAERVKGQIKILPEWDRYVDTARKHDLRMLVILSYGNSFYDNGQSPRTPEGMAAFTRYATTLVGHFKGRISHFEIWNEWNGGMGNRDRQTPEVYAKLLEIVYPAIKKANPQAVVIGGVTAGTDLGWIERVLKAGGGKLMDAVSIHPYSYPNSPDGAGFVKNLELTKALLLRYDCDMPVYVTEIGWPTQLDRRGVTELMSGAYAVRMHVLGIASGIPEAIFWYDLQNDGTDLQYNENNFGLLRCWQGEEVPWSAKDNYLAYNTMTAMLRESKFQEAFQQDSKRIFRFSKQGKDLLVLWSTSGTENIGLRAAGQVELTDLFGNKIPLSPVDGVATVTISALPQYLSGNFDGIEPVAPAFAMENSELKVVAGEKAKLQIKSPGGKNGRFYADLPTGWQLEGETKFAGNSDVQLQIGVAPQAVEQSYEILLYPAAGNEILGQLQVTCNVINPILVTATPQVAAGGGWVKWDLKLELENHSSQQAASGLLTVREPAGWAERIEPIPFKNLLPGSKQTIVVAAPALPAEGAAKLLLELRLNTGQTLTFDRNVSFLAAIRAKEKPQIDGELSEWKGAMPFVMDQASQIKLITGWGGKTDLSGTGYLMWDQENLYLAVEVTDNQHYQAGLGSDSWQGDGIQFAIDPGRQQVPGSMGFHELGFALSGTEVVNWRWSAPSGFDVGNLPQFAGAVRRTGTKTVYEAAIKWSDLLPQTLEPKSGALLGFSLLVNDNDGAGRRGWIEYMSGIGLSKDAYAFGDLLLID